MRPVLVDTNAYVAFMRGESEIVDVLRKQTCFTSTASSSGSCSPASLPARAKP